ncbi:MAG: protein phosphatase CheZ [Nitrospirae bacterium]|nr:protein phosphatase CheZ [Nitrospirota bacterium]
MQAQKQSEGVLQLVGFSVGGEKFAVNIADVHEINRYEHINRMPELPGNVLGVIDLRGLVIPVIDLGGKLGIPAGEITKDTRIIIVGLNGDKIGILVDAVSEVLRVSDKSLEDPPAITKSISSEYISGIIRNNGYITIVLDLAQLFKDYGQGSGLADTVQNTYENKSDFNVSDCSTNDIDQLVHAARAMSQGDFQHEVKEELYGQLGDIARYINTTIKKMQAVEPNITHASDKIPQASVQLSEISRATEAATHTVMGQVEKVLDNHDLIIHHAESAERGNDLVNSIGEVKNVVSENREILMDIITSLSFQDLTGQKIKMIVGLIEDVEKRLLQLIVTFGLKSKDSIEGDSSLKQFTSNPTLKQDVVDNILKEFGFD